MLKNENIYIMINIDKNIKNNMIANEEIWDKKYIMLQNMK